MRTTRTKLAAVTIALLVLTGITGYAMAQSGGGGAPAAPGDPGREGAVAFPPGVSFEEAIVALHVAQSSGTATLAMERVEPLPAGVVALIPRESDGRVVLDLARPFRYDSDLGAAIAPTYTGPEPGSDTPRSDLGPWYQGWKLVVPSLPECMVIHVRGEEPAACTDADKVTGSTSAALP
jgi:hypothetical protein